jgi:tetraacyldisaccharide 4'-kinase
MPFSTELLPPTFSILLSDYHRPFYKDYVLPSGRLRESRKGARRADVVIVSKCPPLLTAKEGVAITSQIRKYSQAAAPVYFTGIQYGQPIPYHGHDEQPDFALSRVLLVSGVANPLPLEHYVQAHYQLVHHIRFKDHHTYTGQDVLRMQENLVHYQADVILTTEKDYVKLMQPVFETRVAALPFYYLPMEVCFLFGHKEEFDKYLWQALNHKKTNY